MRPDSAPIAVAGGGGHGTDRPGTAGPTAAGGGGGGSAPLQPLSQQQAQELLRHEIDQAVKARNTGTPPPPPASGILNVCFNYSISLPYAACNHMLLDTRKEALKRTQRGGSTSGAGSDAPATAPAPAAAESSAARLGGASCVGCFCRAALYDGPACLREVLGAGGRVDARDLVNSTGLHKAASNGDRRALRLLLGARANIDAANLYGDTCLHRAVENSRLATLAELIRHGAQLDKPNNQGNTPLHLACAIGHDKLVRALLSAGAMTLAYNLKGYVPLHTCIQYGQRQTLETLMSFHSNRRLAWADLCVAKTNDTPLHVAVRALRVKDLIWMVEAGGFSAGLVMKNVENRDVIKLMKEAKKLLSKMTKYRKKALKAAKQGKDPPPPPQQIVFPSQYQQVEDLEDPRDKMAKQKPGTTEAYLLHDPGYVNFQTTPLPPPEPSGKKGKKGKGGGKKAKKEKIVPPPVFTLGVDEAVERLDGKGGAFIEEAITQISKKYEEEKKAAEKLAQEKAKAKAAAEKEAKAKEAKGKKK